MGSSNSIKTYIKACVYLYGIIHKDRVLKLYNFHYVTNLEELPAYEISDFDDNFIYVARGFFIHEAIYFNNEMIDYLTLTKDLPYYVPNLDELLNYADQFYFQRTRHHDTFETYMHHVIFPNDQQTAENIIDDVFYSAQLSNDINFSLKHFKRRYVDFDRINMPKLISYLENVLNNSRMWKYNALTYNEFKHFQTQGSIIPFNGLCHCHSGKKYKRCCYPLEKALWDEDCLSYDETFEIEDDEMDLFFTKIEDQFLELPEFIRSIENPSLIDLLDSIFDLAPIDMFEEDPIHVLLSIVLLFNNYHNIEYKVIEPFVKKYQLNESMSHIQILKKRYQTYLDSDDENSLMTFKKPMINYFIKHNYYHLVHVFDDKPYKFLMKVMKKKKIDRDLVDETHELVELLYKNEGKILLIDLYNILKVCPYAFMVIEMMMTDSMETDERIDLLEAFVFAYEAYHEDMFKNSPQEFTHHELNKTYILALDTLGMLYKEQGQFKKAIKVYEKIITYDDEDRFGAKESILICYVLTNQIKRFDDTLNLLAYDSVYYLVLTMYTKMILKDSFYQEYIELLKRSPDLLDVLLDKKSLDDIEYDLPVQMFLADFCDFLKANREFLEPLKRIHLDQNSNPEENDKS